MEQSIQCMAGVSLILFGLSYLVATRDWIMWIEHLERHGRRASLTLGSLNLLIGSFILAFHWVWQGWSMLVSAIGVIALIKGTVYLLCPGWLPKKLSILHKKLANWLKVSGILLAVLGVLILHNWGQEIGYWQNWQLMNTAGGLAYVD